jgi:hypothetical protein
MLVGTVYITMSLSYIELCNTSLEALLHCVLISLAYALVFRAFRRLDKFDISSAWEVLHLRS